jgi:hypothetical protein
MEMSDDAKVNLVKRLTIDRESTHRIENDWSEEYQTATVELEDSGRFIIFRNMMFEWYNDYDNEEDPTFTAI